MNTPRTRTFQGRGGKTATCGKCKAQIDKGTRYVSVRLGFRGSKLIRCTKHECQFRQSEYTTSKMQGVYAASESGHDSIDDITDVDTAAEQIESILSEVAENWREVAAEYQEAAESAGGLGESWIDKADSIESAADELESFSAVVEGEVEEGEQDERLETAKQEAHDAIDSAESNVE